MGGLRLPLHTEMKKGSLAIVGIGPGRREYMTPRALKAIAGADYVIGNASYLDPLEPLLSGKTVIRSSMGKRLNGHRRQLNLPVPMQLPLSLEAMPACTVWPGIVLEVLEHSGADIEVEVIPGVTAANAAASRVGSPLSGDFAVISLSDLLTPFEVIEQRLDAMFSVGIPVVLYNPKSRGRPYNFLHAIEHARKYLGPETPLAVVRNALRDDEEVIITTLAGVEKVQDKVDMHTTVIIGGKESRIWRMGEDVKGIITPRGYQRKYVY